MTAAALLDQLHAVGARVTARGGELIVTASPHGIPAGLLDRVRAAKAQLLRHLAGNQNRRPSPAGLLAPEDDPAEAETRAGFLEFDCGLARAEAERMAGARPLVDTVDTHGAFDTVDTSGARVRETPRAPRRVLRPSPTELAVMLGWPLPREGDPPADAVCTTCGLGALPNLGLLTFLDGHFAHGWCPPPARRDTLRRPASAGRGRP